MAKPKGEEERPPIIVRGGSLVVESGDSKSKYEQKRKGKKWKSETDDGHIWKSAHPNGSKVSHFDVTVEFGKLAAAPVKAKQVLVTYVVEDDPDPVFVVVCRASTINRIEPLVTVSAPMVADNSDKKEQPSLTLDRVGRIFSAMVGNTVHYGPTRVVIQPVGVATPMKSRKRN